MSGSILDRTAGAVPVLGHSKVTVAVTSMYSGMVLADMVGAILSGVVAG